MNDDGAGSTINRVLLALDAPLRDPELLQIAVALAANRKIELVTLFIEDQELFHLASLPFTQEIDRVSARERKLDSFQIARTFRVQAREIGRALERMTQQPRVNHTLKIVRGLYMNEVHSALTGMDVVFLRREIGTYKKRFMNRPSDVLAARGHTPGKHNAVWIIYNGTAGSERALSTACDIVLADNRDLVIVLHTVAAAAADMRRQAETLLRDRAIKALYAIAPESEDEVLVRMLDTAACGLVVMQVNGGARSEALTSLFLRQLECPLALVP